MEAQKHTAGPWGWRQMGQHLALVARHSGTLIVMDFVRKGMSSAQPRFARRTDNMGGLLVKADEWGDLNDHPDAQLMAAAPTLLDFVQEVATQYDHDQDAHKYGTRCRVCEAEKLIAAVEGREP